MGKAWLVLELGNLLPKRFSATISTTEIGRTSEVVRLVAMRESS